MVITKRLVTLSLSDVHPYPNNPRINDEAVDAVMSSIKQTANLDPIEVDEDHVILSGHTRYKALLKLNYTETPTLVITGLTESQKRKYRILANKTQEYATWDIDKLNVELEDLTFSDDFDFFPDIDETQDVEDTPYSQKIQGLKYEPHGSKPPLPQLTDTTKYAQALETINNLDLPEEEKQFLRLAATRYIQFNYGDIAEYYAQSEKPTQEAFEDLTLVVVDFGKAIENGFVHLAETLDEAQEQGEAIDAI